MSLRSFLLVTSLIASLAQAESYVLPPEDTNLIGQVLSVRADHEDTLSDLARRHGLGFDQITQANPKVDPWLPGSGTTVVLPKRYVLPDAPREGVVLNLPEMRLYYFPKPAKGEAPKVITYPVSIGRLDWRTPLGLTRVASKVTDPTWTPPESIKKEHAAKGDILPDVVPAGPDNPLGQYALRLGVSGYLIHGTDKPWGIGMRVTHGCIRMYPENIEALYKEVVVGTPVRLLDQPYKAGWLAGTLYLEAYPALEESEPAANDPSAVINVLAKAVEGRRYRVDKEAIRKVVTEKRGIPLPVGGEIP